MNQRGTNFIYIMLGFFAVMVQAAVAAPLKPFEMIEASFDLPDVKGNPFDFVDNDVKVVLTGPDGQEITLPAFFDGGQTWRVRHSPRTAGKYLIKSISLNGQPAHAEALTPTEFDVSAGSEPGFVRVSRDDPSRFAFDDGSPYYPVGYDLAWHRGEQPPIPDTLAAMGSAHLNWSRIWMCSWDGKALDWFQKPFKQPPIGTFAFSAIKQWDQIVSAASANHIYFQMTLQQHGQYSSDDDTNWPIHPWNTANGGWLDNPTQFFSDPKAIALTKSKYRYIIARWGYSPSIMAWELFNEVESTDAYKHDLDSVGRWHLEMAKFIREQDVYHHLVTTSSVTTQPKLWPAMDYYQCHAYPPDLLSAIQSLDSQHLKRPYFYGEIGAATYDADPAPENTIDRVLWGSLMSQSSGAAQYWFWELIEPNQLLPLYTSIQSFIQQSGILSQNHLRPISVAVHTAQRSPLQFGPALGWTKSVNTHFTINPDGTADGISGMSAFLQGKNKMHDMFPFADFDVNFLTPGTFAAHFDQITTAGARVEFSVDGHPVTTVQIANPPSRRSTSQRTPAIDAAIEIPISAGPHQIHVENSGGDWIHIRDFTLTPYAPQLAVLAKGNNSFAALWIYRRKAGDETGVSGTIDIPGLSAGDYHIVWWDTRHGTTLKTETQHADESIPLTLTTPVVTDDVSAWITHLK